MLTEAQFQELNGDCWRLMNGSSLTGTDYGVFTGMENLPDTINDGTFLRQAKVGRTLGSFENDAFQGHWHDFYVGNTSNGFPHGSGSNQIAKTDNAGGRVLESTAGGAKDIINHPKSDTTNGIPRTANETRPKNIAVNFFIKVNRQCNFN